MSCCFTECRVGDPIEGENSFAIENTTNDSIQLLFTFTTNVESNRAGKTDSVIVAPQQVNKFLRIIGGVPVLTPNYVFEKIVFTSLENDTIHIMDIIDDKEWILTDSVKDYGYKVGYYHWLYKYTE